MEENKSMIPNDEDLKRVKEEIRQRSEQQLKDLNDMLDKRAEEEAKFNQDLFNAYIKDNDRRGASKMEQEIEEAKARAEAEIRARYSKENRREWNESKTDKAFKEMAKNLKI